MKLTHAAAVLTVFTLWGARPAPGAAPAPAGTNAALAPPVIVQEHILTEDRPVGPYRQPEWTTERRFPTTRVYLQQPPGEVGVEQWWRMRALRDNTYEHELQEEVEIGLPYRFQFDFYETWAIDDDRNASQSGVSAELRYALADWGRFPLNPTLYVEYEANHDGPDELEMKVLFGDQVGDGWHYGINVVGVQTLGGERETEMALAGALGWSVIDRRLSIGLETKFVRDTVQDRRSDPEEKFELGPSVQWRPTPRLHLDVVPLFGLSHDAPRVESYVVLGYDFGPVLGTPRVAPVSTLRE